MEKKKRILTRFLSTLVLIGFVTVSLASSSQKSSSSSGSGYDWGGAARGAAVGGAAGYNGYTIIGKASSESQAKDLAARKGYSYYLWDSVNGAVYAK